MADKKLFGNFLKLLINSDLQTQQTAFSGDGPFHSLQIEATLTCDLVHLRYIPSDHTEESGGKNRGGSYWLSSCYSEVGPKVKERHEGNSPNRQQRPPWIAYTGDQTGAMQILWYRNFAFLSQSNSKPKRVIEWHHRVVGIVARWAGQSEIWDSLVVWFHPVPVMCRGQSGFPGWWRQQSYSDVIYGRCYKAEKCYKVAAIQKAAIKEKPENIEGCKGVPVNLRSCCFLIPALYPVQETRYCALLHPVWRGRSEWF